MKSFKIPMLSTRGLAMSLLGLCLLSGLDTPPARADFTFGEPVNLAATVNSPYDDGTPVISPDGLEMYILSNRPGGYGGYDIWVAKRANVRDDWGIPEVVGQQVNSSSLDNPASISADGLSFYFSSTRPGGYGDFDMYTTTRPTREAPWVPAVNLGQIVNGSGADDLPVISADGLELFFDSNRAGGVGSMDIWVSMRASISDPWAPPMNLGSTVNSTSEEVMGCILSDGLTLFFNSRRSNGFGNFDIWMITRPYKGAAWSAPVNLGPSLNTSYCEWIDSMSRDGLSLYFDDSYGVRPGGIGGADIWQAPIIPIVDFNGDGIVDVKDVVILTDHWSTNYSLCDIGPTPLGDGIVDVRDLIVLAEYIEPEYIEPEIVPELIAMAHWKLDETDGMFAQDSASDNNAYVIGNPVWQPTGGQVNGALQLDGVDDCIVTNAILNPAGGPFSVFVWVRGGAPGQVVLSQIGGASWLRADSLEGNLMTELKGLGQSAGPLLSQTVITDGNWHRIGFVWDVLYRMLYVDDIAVAEDTQDSLEGSSNGLYIGTGKAMEAGTYWSGLIDDIRIYNRVITP